MDQLLQTFLCMFFFFVIVDDFLVYRMFYKNKPETARNKGFRHYVDSKAITLNPRKWNYYSVRRKTLDLKLLIQVFLRAIFRYYFYSRIFIIGIDLVSSSLLEKRI